VRPVLWYLAFIFEHLLLQRQNVKQCNLLNLEFFLLLVIITHAQLIYLFFFSILLLLLLPFQIVLRFELRIGRLGVFHWGVEAPESDLASEIHVVAVLLYQLKPLRLISLVYLHISVPICGFSRLEPNKWVILLEGRLLKIECFATGSPILSRILLLQPQWGHTWHVRLLNCHSLLTPLKELIMKFHIGQLRWLSKNSSCRLLFVMNRSVSHWYIHLECIELHPCRKACLSTAPAPDF
jgi:hypothetical protein